MLRLPSQVVDGGDHVMVREENYFGIRLQVRKEFMSQQVVVSARSAEIASEDIRIKEEQRLQSLVQSVDRAKLLEMMGLPTNNTNDTPADKNNAGKLLMDLDTRDDDSHRHWSDPGNDGSIHTSDGEEFSDDEEDAEL